MTARWRGTDILAGYSPGGREWIDQSTNMNNYRGEKIYLSVDYYKVSYPILVAVLISCHDNIHTYLAILNLIR